MIWDKGVCDDCLDADSIPDGTPCQLCCPHFERDHFICLDCGHEQDPGEAIDRAMDSIDKER